MPEFKNLRSVLERLKNMSPVLTISAESTGVLSFKVDTDTATITIHFPDLAISNFNIENNDLITTNIDMKKFHAFLAWDSVHPTKILCNIVNEHVVNLDLSLDDYLQIKYYIPAVASF